MGIGGNMQPFEDYADAPRGEHEEKPLKNGESSSEIVLPKFKHPKMYHIHDSPGGGGPNAAPIDAIVASGKSKAGRFSRQADLEANPPEYSVTDTESLNKDNTALTRKYPPRRKNSAIRDFPAFCGRDARRPTKEEYIRMGLGHLHEEMLAKDAEAMSNEVAVHNDQVRGVQRNLGNKVLLHEQNSVQKYPSGVFGNNIGINRLGVKSFNRKSPSIQQAAKHTSKLVLLDAVDVEEADEERKDQHVARRSDDFKVNVAPLVQRSSISGGSNIHSIGARNKVRETLRYFQVVFRKLLQEHEAALQKGQPGLRGIYLAAAKIVKSKGKYVNIGESILGTVPGVEVGDEFHYRVELAMVGLHRLSQGGIDYVRKGTKTFATSIVASGAYANDLSQADELTYTGSGGNIAIGCKKGLKPEDQKLERGNLAMKNSADANKQVRVIRGFQDTKNSVITYTYDGLYTVDGYWPEREQLGNLVFKFKLVRVAGQAELTWNEVNKSKKTKVSDENQDISRGIEKFPVRATNTINRDKPPQFNYISSIIKPNWFNPTPPRGCGCKDMCADSDKCYCAAKNGSVIPYNRNGCIVEFNQLVFECGPACKCPKSCCNRVSQHGPKFHLEIFKTNSRGWGARSLDSIPSGSFICEYLGEILSDKEAELKIGHDEYLFDIGQNYKDLNNQNGHSDHFEDCGFTIDAETYGNIGRFINHSCSPNLYAQSVLYDHEDKRMPHIMFFAAENIPPLKELTFHYNYKIDQVHDSNGNIKKKSCHCGSSECIGRLY